MSAAKIVSICEELLPQYKSDNVGFVRNVAKRMGFDLPADADEVIDRLRAEWRVLSSGAAAKEAADAGEFVIAGLKRAEHFDQNQRTHVVVVVKGPIAEGKYPTGYWGRDEDSGQRNLTLNFAWRFEDRDRVTYAAAPPERMAANIDLPAAAESDAIAVKGEPVEVSTERIV